MSDVAELAALEGRMPVLPDERLFKSTAAFVWSCTVFGSAIWVFMVGAGLSALGDVRYVIPGFMIGAVIGFILAMMASGLPSFRYGIDTIDAARATFGPRGAILTLFGLLYVALAWPSVLTAFIARGTTTVVAQLSGQPFSNSLEVILALAVVAISWVVVQSGPAVMERVNNVVGPSIIAIATILLILLARKIGWNNIWTDSVPSTGWLFPDRKVAVISAVELGVGASLGLWPFLGGLTRLAQRRSMIVTPALFGTTIIGLSYGSAVAALVAHAMPSADPVMWFLQLGGPVIGALCIMAILIGNISVIGLMIYLAGVSAQQIEWVRLLPWRVIVAMLLVPPAFAAFHADTVLSSVLAISNYQGMVFVGIIGVGIVNYYLRLRERIDLPSVFARPGQGLYAGTAGIDWIAVISAVAGSVLYRFMYDPLSLVPGPGFLWFGASLPSVIFSAVLFLVLKRIWGRPVGQAEILKIDLKL